MESESAGNEKRVEEKLKEGIKKTKSDSKIGRERKIIAD